MQLDPEVVDVFLHITAPAPPPQPNWRLVGTADLQAGMVLAADLVSPRGHLMLTAGQALSERLILRIREFEARNPEPLLLQVRRRPGEL